MSDSLEFIGSMGWIPGKPSVFDNTVDEESIAPKLLLLNQQSIKSMLNKVGAGDSRPSVPASVDLRAWCSPIEDQMNLGSCTAHAGVGILEYFERRAFNKHVDASRLFLYKVTRNLMHVTGDTGATLRKTMQAMTVFGVPPEEYWPYNTPPKPDYDVEPPAFCYSFALSYNAITYYRLDPAGVTDRQAILQRIKTNLSTGLPSMFGFTVYDSIRQAASNGGKIPFPIRGERVLGGHAIDAVGYDDAMMIRNAGPGGVETTGALLIRNSWGTAWGDRGYGWLPYDYVLRGLAVDWWSMLKAEWVDTGNFHD